MNNWIIYILFTSVKTTTRLSSVLIFNSYIKYEIDF